MNDRRSYLRARERANERANKRTLDALRKKYPDDYRFLHSHYFSLEWAKEEVKATSRSGGGQA